MDDFTGFSLEPPTASGSRMEATAALEASGSGSAPAAVVGRDEGGEDGQEVGTVAQRLAASYRESAGEDQNALPTHLKLVRALTLVQLGLARGAAAQQTSSTSVPYPPRLGRPSSLDSLRTEPQRTPFPDPYSPSPFDAYHPNPPHTPFSAGPVGHRAGGGGGQLDESDFASLIGLLASALGDLAPYKPGSADPPTTTTVVRDQTPEQGRWNSPPLTPASPIFSAARRGETAVEPAENDELASPPPPPPLMTKTKMEEIIERARKVLSVAKPRPSIKRRHSVDTPGQLAEPEPEPEPEPVLAPGLEGKEGTENAEGGREDDLASLIVANCRMLARYLERSRVDPPTEQQPKHFEYDGGPGALPAPSHDVFGVGEADGLRVVEGRETPGAEEEDPYADDRRRYQAPPSPDRERYIRALLAASGPAPLRCCRIDEPCPHGGRTESERRTNALADPTFNLDRSPMLRLPPELQRRILREARSLSEDSAAWVPTEPPVKDDATRREGGGSNRRRRGKDQHPVTTTTLPLAGPSILAGTGIIYGLPNSQDPYTLNTDLPHPPPGLPTRPRGGRRVAQEYAHSLSTLCKDLSDVARSCAWESVHIRTRRQVQALVTLWKGEFDDYDDGRLKVGDKRYGPGGRFANRNGRGRLDPLWPGVEIDCSPISSVNSFDSFIPGPDPGASTPYRNPDRPSTPSPTGKAPLTEGESSPRPDAASELRKQARKAELQEAGRAVRCLNIEVPAATGDLDFDKGSSRRPARRPRRRRNVYHQGLRTAPDLAASLAELQHSRKAAAEAESQQLPQLFSMTPNLQQLIICINPARGASYPNGGLNGHGFGFEGFGSEVLDSLCGLHALRSLTLKSGIDFSELEVLLPHLNELTELRLEGGLDSVDGRGDVDPELHHRCRLKTFTLQNLDFDGDVSADQLCWILGQSVGHLEHLDLIVYAGGGPGHNAWLNGGAPGANAAFACRAFADLLVRLGPTLRHLALRDCSSFGSVHHDLSQPPHSGYLDYALLHCSKLTQLAIEFFVTGPALLDCLSADREALEAASEQDDDNGGSPDDALSHIDLSPRPLQVLTFFGSPEHTSAKRMTAAINNPSALPNLKSVTLAAFPSQRSGQQVPWATRDLRKLREACQEKRVWLGFV